MADLIDAALGTDGTDEVSDRLTAILNSPGFTVPRHASTSSSTYTAPSSLHATPSKPPPENPAVVLAALLSSSPTPVDTVWRTVTWRRHLGCDTAVSCLPSSLTRAQLDAVPPAVLRAMMLQIAPGNRDGALWRDDLFTTLTDAPPQALAAAGVASAAGAGLGGALSGDGASEADAAAAAGADADYFLSGLDAADFDAGFRGTEYFAGTGIDAAFTEHYSRSPHHVYLRAAAACAGALRRCYGAVAAAYGAHHREVITLRGVAGPSTVAEEQEEEEEAGGSSNAPADASGPGTDGGGGSDSSTALALVPTGSGLLRQVVSLGDSDDSNAGEDPLGALQQQQRGHRFATPTKPPQPTHLHHQSVGAGGAPSVSPAAAPTVIGRAGSSSLPSASGTGTGTGAGAGANAGAGLAAAAATGKRRTAVAAGHDPLSLSRHDSTVWAQRLEHVELRQLIAKDVARTHAGRVLFCLRATRRLLQRVLLTWALDHPEVGYRQGMNEVLALVVLALRGDCDANSLFDMDGDDEAAAAGLAAIDVSPDVVALLDPRANEADAYALFDRIMARIAVYYGPAEAPLVSPAAAAAAAAAAAVVSASGSGFSPSAPQHVHAPSCPLSARRSALGFPASAANANHAAGALYSSAGGGSFPTLTPGWAMKRQSAGPGGSAAAGPATAAAVAAGVAAAVVQAHQPSELTVPGAPSMSGPARPRSPSLHLAAPTDASLSTDAAAAAAAGQLQPHPRPRKSSSGAAPGISAAPGAARLGSMLTCTCVMTPVAVASTGSPAPGAGLTPGPSSGFGSGSGSGSGEGGTLLARKINHIHDTLLRRADPAVHAALEAAGALPQLFLLRWLRLLFAREFPPSQALQVWDHLFAHAAELNRQVGFARAPLDVEAHIAARVAASAADASAAVLGLSGDAEDAAEERSRLETLEDALALRSEARASLYLQEDPGLGAAVDFFALAMILHVRRRLLCGDAGVVLMTVMQYPPVDDVRALCAQARSLFAASTVQRHGAGPYSGAGAGAGSGASAAGGSAGAAAGGGATGTGAGDYYNSAYGPSRDEIDAAAAAAVAGTNGSGGSGGKGKNAVSQRLALAVSKVELLFKRKDKDKDKDKDKEKEKEKDKDKGKGKGVAAASSASAPASGEAPESPRFLGAPDDDDAPRAAATATAPASPTVAAAAAVTDGYSEDDRAAAVKPIIIQVNSGYFGATAPPQPQPSPLAGPAHPLQGDGSAPTATPAGRPRGSTVTAPDASALALAAAAATAVDGDRDRDCADLDGDSGGAGDRDRDEAKRASAPSLAGAVAVSAAAAASVASPSDANAPEVCSAVTSNSASAILHHFLQPGDGDVEARFFEPTVYVESYPMAVPAAELAAAASAGAAATPGRDTARGYAGGSGPPRRAAKPTGLGNDRTCSEGYLVKLSGGTGLFRLRNFRRRWFVLRGFVLQYYRDRKAEAPMKDGYIDLRGRSVFSGDAGKFAIVVGPRAAAEPNAARAKEFARAARKAGSSGEQATELVAAWGEDALHAELVREERAAVAAETRAAAADAAVLATLNFSSAASTWGDSRTFHLFAADRTSWVAWLGLLQNATKGGL
jgi:hypothetical protein